MALDNLRAGEDSDDDAGYRALPGELLLLVALVYVLYILYIYSEVIQYLYLFFMRHIVFKLQH